MQHCRNCGTRVGMRLDRVWVHAATRAKHCSLPTVLRPRAEPEPG